MIKKITAILPKKAKKIYNVSLMTFMFLLISTGSAFASPPKIVSGSVKLAHDVTGWLLLIIPVGAGAFAGYQYLQKTMTEDEGIIAQKNKIIKNTIMSAAVGMGIDSLVILILAYYA